jgi:hypothetical protein
LEKAARTLRRTPVLILLIAEKLGLCGNSKNNFDSGHASSFSRGQDCRRDKPARARRFAKHMDLSSI